MRLRRGTISKWGIVEIQLLALKVGKRLENLSEGFRLDG